MPKDAVRVLVFCGTRPEAIKLAPLIKMLERDPDFDVAVCVTGQHRTMLDQVFAAFDLTAAFDLDVMRPGQTLPDLTARIVTAAAGVIRRFHPRWVIVQGDTTTAFAAALAAFYEQVDVAHVEAGLRTGDRYSPFPEELNRRLAGQIARLHFAPTPTAKANLLREGFPARQVFVTGNSVIDALLSVAGRVSNDAALRAALDQRFAFLAPGRKLALVTGHRRESFGEPFRNICLAFVDLARQREDLDILYPVHLNPNVRQPVDEILRHAPADVAHRIHLIEPVDYVAFVYLMNRADLVITDSGGVQEEAPALGKPVLVTRENTERPEAVEAGAAELVGSDRKRIVAASVSLLDGRRAQARLPSSPYGDGQACARMTAHLKQASGGAPSAVAEFRFVPRATKIRAPSPRAALARPSAAPEAAADPRGPGLREHGTGVRA